MAMAETFDFRHQMVKSLLSLSGTQCFARRLDVVLALLPRLSVLPHRSCLLHRKVPSPHSELLRGGPIMTPMVAAKKLSKFDPKAFLSTIDGGRKIAALAKEQTIFVQGDSSDAVFYIQKGKIRPTVVSQIGKEATIGILNEGDFFGEGCLTGQPLRLCSA